MEINPTWSRLLVVWWAFAWRNLIALVVSMILGTIAGFVVGFILGAMGFPIAVIQAVSATLGLLIGLALSIVPLKMIIGKDFGEFRLVLLSTNVDPSYTRRPKSTGI